MCSSDLRPGLASWPRVTSRPALVTSRPRPVAWGLLLVLAENRGHDGPINAGADDVGRRSPAQRQAHRIYEDGLARAGLPRKQIQPTTELDGEVFDHRVILNVEFVQHRGSTGLFCSGGL